MYKPTEKQRLAVALCAGPQRHTLLEGGARSGKTFTFVRNTILRAVRGNGSRHLIARSQANACHQSVYLDTYPKVLATCFPGLKPKPHAKDGYDKLANGSEIWFSGLDDKERVEKILGKEFATVYLNECSQITYSTALLVLTRLAQKVNGLQNRAYYDLNPLSTTHWTQRLFYHGLDPVTRHKLSDPQNYASMLMNPVDNIENIDPEFIRSLEAMPERLRTRFLLGKPVSDLDNALWHLENLEQQRIDRAPTGFDRIVVSIDPSGASGEEDERSDEIGIAVVGRKHDKGYLLRDATAKLAPEKWGALAVKLYREYSADCIVGEVNYGGDMVRATIHAIDRNIRFKKVTATRGKVVRAEPVSALYEQKKMFHVGAFSLLEDELLSFTTDGYKGDRSPNRADALVWAVHELLLTEQNTGLLEFYRMDHERRTGKRAA